MLLLAACAFAGAGLLLKSPHSFRRPGRVGAGVLLAAWVIGLVSFLIGFTIYAEQEARDFPKMTAPSSPIEPVTIAAAVAIAVLIGAGTKGSVRERVTSGALGALAAPMIFELPFDLVVMTRTYPPVTPDPGLYRAVFFAPLFLVEITTIVMLTLAPAARVSRSALWSVGLLLAVFSGWATLGFAYPSTPATIALNVTGKLLAFTAVVCIFAPHPIRQLTEHTDKAHPKPY